MKNFSMPEQVSPTLEIDELMRLKHSLEKNVSREVAESIIKEIPLSINSTPDIRAEWVEKLSAILEKRFEKTAKNIRQECYCNENGAGWFIKDNQLLAKMFESRTTTTGLQTAGGPEGRRLTDIKTRGRRITFPL